MSAPEFAYTGNDHMLPRPFRMDDPSGRGGHVRNVETLCRSVLNRAVESAWPDIERVDYDESLGMLLGECAIQHDVYLRRHQHLTIAFGPWLQVQLYRRLVDFWRSFYKRGGLALVPRHTEGGVDDDGAGADRLDQVAAGRDDPADRGDAGGWLLAAADRNGARSE